MIQPPLPVLEICLNETNLYSISLLTSILSLIIATLEVNLEKSESQREQPEKSRTNGENELVKCTWAKLALVLEAIQGLFSKYATDVRKWREAFISQGHCGVAVHCT